MPIAEPLTTWTDYLLAAASLAFAIGIGRSIGRHNAVSGWCWCGAFAAATIAAGVGGTWHGFAPLLSAGTLDRLWSLTMSGMGACAAFSASAIHASRVRRGDGTIAWLAAALVTTLAGAAVQQGLADTGAAIDRNAAYHLIQLVGLYCLYRCARTTRDRAADACPGADAGRRL